MWSRLWFFDPGFAGNVIGSDGVKFIRWVRLIAFEGMWWWLIIMLLSYVAALLLRSKIVEQVFGARPVKPDGSTGKAASR